MVPEERKQKLMKSRNSSPRNEQKNGALWLLLGELSSPEMLVQSKGGRNPLGGKGRDPWKWWGLSCVL
jgi:hypothetical protein